jgi:hypothetical protein
MGKGTSAWVAAGVFQIGGKIAAGKVRARSTRQAGASRCIPRARKLRRIREAKPVYVMRRHRVREGSEGHGESAYLARV